VILYKKMLDIIDTKLPLKMRLADDILEMVSKELSDPCVLSERQRREHKRDTIHEEQSLGKSVADTRGGKRRTRGRKRTSRKKKKSVKKRMRQSST
jgi:hypothetical protein